MPYDLPLAGTLIKNQTSQGCAYLPLLEITIPSSPDLVVRVVNNNENIVWNGHVWQAFPFELGEIPENVDEIPSVDLKVCNINQLLEEYYELTDGGAGGIAILRIVRFDALDQPAMITHEFNIKMSTITDDWVTLQLGFDTSMNARRPRDLFKAKHCDWRFKGVQCGYAGPETICNHTLARCNELGNFLRFKGAPAITNS